MCCDSSIRIQDHASSQNGVYEKNDDRLHHITIVFVTTRDKIFEKNDDTVQQQDKGLIKKYITRVLGK
jgi:hypothetical protein